MLGGLMTVIFLVFGLGLYLLIMFGLTFWLQRYHDYQKRFYSKTSTETTEPTGEPLDLKCGATSEPESKYRENRQSEVGGGK
jgi:hypothetical protein